MIQLVGLDSNLSKIIQKVLQIMKPVPWNIDIKVSWLPLPYEIQSKIFKFNRTVTFRERIGRLDKILHLKPMINNGYAYIMVLSKKELYNFRFIYFPRPNQLFFDYKKLSDSSWGFFMYN
jgi:hypothetical protein